jgi:hypothetical protein
LEQNLPCTELVAKRAISLSFPLEKEVKTLCIKISIQPLFRFYSVEIWQEHTSKYTKAPLNIYKPNNG